MAVAKAAKKGKKYTSVCSRWPNAIVAKVEDIDKKMVYLRELPPYEHCLWQCPENTFPESWLPVKEPAKT